MDTDFRTVMTGCAQTRIKSGQGTWIDEEMITAYGDLHDLGYAHSVEVWKDGVLCGGLYGVSLGRCFFGESMFSGISGASKAALIALARHLERHAFTMIDCQTQTRHLMRMGAQPLPRSLFLSLLKRSLDIPAIIGKWNFEIDSDFDGFFKIRS
jgi:leucyl/phenylalanyl-tRNA--protein transferase